MITEPLDPQQVFEDLLIRALAGDPPPTESGLDQEVIDALYLVVVQQTQESADNARSVFDRYR